MISICFFPVDFTYEDELLTDSSILCALSLRPLVLQLFYEGSEKG